MEKIQLTIAINFISSTDTDDTKDTSDKVETIIYDKADEVIEELFESFWKLVHSYYLHYSKTFLLVPDPVESTKNFVTVECSTLFVLIKI